MKKFLAFIAILAVSVMWSTYAQADTTIINNGCVKYLDSGLRGEAQHRGRR